MGIKETCFDTSFMAIKKCLETCVGASLRAEEWVEWALPNLWSVAWGLSGLGCLGFWLFSAWLAFGLQLSGLPTLARPSLVCSWFESPESLGPLKPRRTGSGACLRGLGSPPPTPPCAANSRWLARESFACVRVVQGFFKHTWTNHSTWG